MAKDKNKPKGAMTPYAIFVKHSREELKKKNPSAEVNFAAFSKQCAEKWKSVSAKDKKKFEEIAGKDKERFRKEMKDYIPSETAGKKKSKKETDPNAPKRPLSAFFLFCADERSKVKKEHPDMKVSDMAKELGLRWVQCKNKTVYETKAQADKGKYEKAVAKYKAAK